MAIKKTIRATCDKCGAVEPDLIVGQEPPYNWMTVLPAFGPSASRKRLYGIHECLALCPDCRDLFVDFIKGKNVRPL